ncbi:EamA family transporter [Acidianus sp. HS-5]|nr:EamA family transporter [Acidianus sp. HS-5]
MGVIIVWGLSFPLSKIALYFMSPFVLTFLRFTIGGLILAIYGKGIIYGKREAINAILNMGIFVILLNLAINYSKNPALASVLIYMQPIFVAVFTRIKGEEILLPQLIGIIISFIGIFISVDSVNFSIGSLIAIIAAILWAIGTLYYAKLKDRNVVKLNAFMSLFSSLFVLPTIPFGFYFKPSAVGLALGVLVAIIAQALGFMFWFSSVKDLGATTASSIVILVPVSAYIFSFIILNQIPNIFQIMGSSLALIGVFISQYSRVHLSRK